MKITAPPERAMAAVSFRRAWERVAHVAVELGARHQRRHRVDHDHVHGVRAHQRLGDLQRLLARVGLGNQELVGVDAQVLGVDGIEGVLGVDEGGRTAPPLGLGDDVQRQRRLARGLRAVDLGDAAAGDAADAERDVERQRPRRDDGDLVEDAALAQAHDGALAELPVDGRDRQIEGLPPIAFRYFSHGFSSEARKRPSRPAVK
jgi:hypothetical protein